MHAVATSARMLLLLHKAACCVHRDFGLVEPEHAVAVKVVGQLTLAADGQLRGGDVAGGRVATPRRGGVAVIVAAGTAIILSAGRWCRSRCWPSAAAAATRWMVLGDMAVGGRSNGRWSGKLRSTAAADSLRQSSAAS